MPINWVSSRKSSFSDVLDEAANDSQRSVDQVLRERGLLDADAIESLKSLVANGANNGHFADKSNDGNSSLRIDSDLHGMLANLGLAEPLSHAHPMGMPPDEYSTGNAATNNTAKAGGSCDVVDGTTASQLLLLNGRRFRKGEKIGEWGLGVVFRGTDLRVERSVAIKELRPVTVHHLELRSRFENEARITGNLDQPGIIPIYDLGKHPDGTPYFAMRLVEGETLKDAIRSAHASDDKEHQIRRLLARFIDVCNTVEFAHSRRIIHRDLKPSNVMLGEFGETIVVDWGLARAMGGETGDTDDKSGKDGAGRTANIGFIEPQQTALGAIIGTLDFISPEQAEGRHSELTERSDIFSLGATLYMICTGKCHEGCRGTR